MATLAGLIACALGGAVVATAVFAAMSDTFAKPLFERTNVRGDPVPVAGGIVIAITAIGVGALLSLGQSAEWIDVPFTAVIATLVATSGFALLGLFDDLAGDGSSRGFAGHLRALAKGRLTTGAVKLFGGAAVALIVVVPVGVGHPERHLVDAALVALAANLANLLDRAPGRVAKATLLAWIPILALAGADERLLAPMAILGATAALLVPDLREKVMLGDTGANVIGAVAGLGVVFIGSPQTRLVVALVVLALNLASERVSFTAVIDATPPLRALDRWGRREP